MTPFNLQARTKEQVRRNIERFPEDFMFVLSDFEWKELVANCDQLPMNIKHASAPPFAFTQEGIAMLSGILRSSIAIQMNIAIMRAFVAVRQIVLVSPYDKVAELEKRMETIENYIEDIFADQNDINEDTRMQIELINQALAELQVKNKEMVRKERPKIGFVKPEE